MPRPAKPFVTPRRVDSKTFQLTLNPTCGLPPGYARVAAPKLPGTAGRAGSPSLPQKQGAASAGALALVTFLKKRQEEGSARRVATEDVTVGEWLEKFTSMETSPRTGINASRNRPNSLDTLENYHGYFHGHIKGDPFTELKMAETEEEDALEYVSRLSVKKLADGRTMGGTRTFVGIVVFVRMAFKDYQKRNRRWHNPFLYIDPPKYTPQTRDALPEDEVVRLFVPGVLRNTMELAVCAAMFLSGLRRSEIYALKPECLDWRTPKIRVKNSWQCYNKNSRVLGPTKGKRERNAPFDPMLQEAIRKLWEENGRHEFVFCRKTGKLPGASWINRNFPRWLARAEIELDGREIVPHSSRHSLASLLEEKGVPIRYIQDLLGHSDLETTKVYLHSTGKTIRDIGSKISEVMAGNGDDGKIVEFKAS